MSHYSLFCTGSLLEFVEKHKDEDSAAIYNADEEVLLAKHVAGQMVKKYSEVVNDPNADTRAIAALGEVVIDYAKRVVDIMAKAVDVKKNLASSFNGLQVIAILSQVEDIIREEIFANSANAQEAALQVSRIKQRISHETNAVSGGTEGLSIDFSENSIRDDVSTMLETVP